MVRETSVDVYHKLKDYLGDVAIKVFIHIDKHPNITRNEIKEETQIPINSVCGRVNELIKYGLVKEGEKRLDVFTKNTVYTLHTIDNIDWNLLDILKLQKRNNSTLAFNYDLVCTIHKVFNHLLEKYSTDINIINELNKCGIITNPEIENVLKIRKMTKGIYDKYSK